MARPKVTIKINQKSTCAPDAIITFDGLPIATVPCGDVLNLNCSQLLNAVFVESTAIGHQHGGVFVLSGTLNGKDTYEKSDDPDRIITYDGTKWVLEKIGGGAHTHDAADGNEDYPWEADWSLENIAMSQATIAEYCDNGVNCEPLEYTITDSDSNVLYTGFINPGDTLNQVIQDADVRNSDSSWSDTVLAEGLLVTPDIDFSVNSIVEGSVPSVKDIDIELEDSLSNPITPTNVTMVGDVLTIEVPSYLPPPPSGDFVVRFFDIDGTILKEQFVDAGNDATAPANPTFDPTYLVFAEWNQPFTNVQNDIDVGAIYDTIDGKTYLFVRITDTTGLQPTLALNKTGTALLTVDWGDSTTDTSTTNGNFTLTKTAAYAAIGDYIITIESTDLHRNQSGINLFNNVTTYAQSLQKAYLGEKINVTQLFFIANCWSASVISINKEIGGFARAFDNCRSLKHCNLPNGPTSARAFLGCNSLVSVSVPVSYADFTESFNQCFSLRKVIMTNATSIGGFAAFNTCYSIESIVIPNGVTNYPASSFNECRSLKSAKIGNAVTTLNGSAFRNCISLTELDFPSTLTTIGAACFINCHSILEYTFLSTTPPTLANINAFTGINAACKIYVPDASVAAYKAATNWSTYANYIYPLSTKP